MGASNPGIPCRGGINVGNGQRRRQRNGRHAVNAPPDFPASLTSAGPTLAPEELAGHKLLALYDRAAARDFVDVYLLVLRFGRDVLLARAAQTDAGFDTRVLADMIATLDRFTDDDIPVPGGLSVSELRAFYTAWRSEALANAVRGNPLARQYYGRPPLLERLLLPDAAQSPARKYLDWHKTKVFIA